MKEEKLTIQDIPLSIWDYLLTPYKNCFTVKNNHNHQFIFIDREERILLESIKPGTTITMLIQVYQQHFGKFSYKKVFELVVALLKNGFFTPDTEQALLQHKIFKSFKPKNLEKVLKPLSFPRIAKYTTSFWNMMDSTGVIILLFLLTLFALAYHFNHYKGVDYVTINGSYFIGLLYWLFCITLIISFKNLYKYFLLIGKGLEVSNPGITIRKIIPYFTLLDSDILRAGWLATLRFHIASVFFPSLLATIGIIIYTVKPVGFISIWILASLIVIFFNISPIIRSELMVAFDRLSGKSRLIESLQTFIARKFILRIFSFGSTFQYESHYITFGIFCFLWLISAYIFVGHVLRLYSENLTHAAVFSHYWYDRGAVLVYLCGIIFPFLIVIWYFIKIVLINLYILIEKPIDFLLKKLWSGSKQIKTISEDEIQALLKEIPLCITIPENQRVDLSKCFQVKYFAKNRKVIWQGDSSDGFYVICRGKAAVIREESSGIKSVLAILSEKDSFGEMALIQDTPRTATVEALTPLVCLILRKEHFKQFIEAQHIENKEQITQLIQLNTFLKTVPMFEDISPDLMNRVILETKMREYQPGEVVIKQGDPGEEFYIIRTGAVAIWKDYQTPTSQQIATLSTGDYFGEIALFENTPRTSTVIAQELSKILMISKPVFFNILQSNVLSGILVENTVKQRKQTLEYLE